MNAANWAVGFALLAGSIRAVELWRAAPRVDVVNVVTLGALAEGRGRELDALLRKVGSAPYFDLVRRVARALPALLPGDDRAVRAGLEREAMLALAAANRSLRRFAWLDSLALAAILFAGIAGLVSRDVSLALSLELLAATLLWLANVRGLRSIATRMYAGATALVEGIVKGRDFMLTQAEADADSRSS